MSSGVMPPDGILKNLQPPYLIFKPALSMVGVNRTQALSRENPMQIFDLTNRVAVVTGGNGGIGLGIAQALTQAGCNVSIWGRNADKNARAAASMAAGPGKLDTQICNVADAASVKSAMAATLQKFGR